MSAFGVRALKALNKVFPKQIHPFNMQVQGEKSYAMWQFEKGEDTIKFFLEKYSAEEMFKDKKVLDFGCGAGGKSLYYASLGAEKVVGIDMVESYEQESAALAEKLGLSQKFTFVLGDATNSGFEDNTFDTIIMNDFMEHVSQPEKVLAEARRIIRPGGRIFINFPPYYHPFGAHISDAVNMPWCHMFFSESTLVAAYKELVRDVPDGNDRIKFRISKKDDGSEYFSYINKMTIKRFRRILKNQSITPIYYNETPVRSIVAPFAKFPLTKEMFVKMVTCVIEK
ncbi:MAG: class I SAM-dependent methyltransferase [Clostridia bacterium]|nr:class I SAM-dependent methyltransferase [Clostridia bacterium]